jgi:hypothetical protein
VIRATRARIGIVGGAVAALVLATPALAAYAHDNSHDNDHDDGDLRTVVSGLDGPRGVAALGGGNTLVTETDGTFSLVIERRHRSPRVVTLGNVTSEFAPAIDTGPDGSVYVLTGAADPRSAVAKNAAKLFVWKSGWRKAKVLADIGAYQARDIDPYDLEKNPKDTNPFGVEALDDGTVLVADAAGNDLLRVSSKGSIQTVARLKPRMVTVPAGLGTTGPEGMTLPPAGTSVPSEAVATSVTVGADGYWYVGELRGFPATPGTSQVWRIRPGSVNAVCDPAAPDTGDCRRYADGLTSLVDLGADEKGSIYALSLSKQSWLRMEMEAPGSEVGGLFEIKRFSDRDHDKYRHRHRDKNGDRDHDRYRDKHGDRGHDKYGDRDDDRHDYGYRTYVRELVPGELVQPGGVDVGSDGDIYLVGPVFGPGSLMKIDD